MACIVPIDDGYDSSDVDAPAHVKGVKGSKKQPRVPGGGLYTDLALPQSEEEAKGAATSRY
jgi:hypothetical protein